jgi:hypothetical protein
MQEIDQIIDEMKTLGKALVEYSFPLATSEDEDSVSILKTREIVVDGYAVVVHYGRGKYEEYSLETFQCLGTRSPFLPFFVVTKLARLFLGEKQLCFVDVMHNGKKVYCWTLTSERDRQIPSAPSRRSRSVLEFEGFRFNYLDPESVNFF